MGVTTVNSAKPIYPQQSHPWFELDLSKEVVQHLWKCVEKGEEKGESYKHSLAGNISTSFKIDDEDEYFANEILRPLCGKYEEHVPDHLRDENPSIAVTKEGKPLMATARRLVYKDFWANYQYKHEFNPAHHHSGVYSFVVWLKIPYDCEEQCKLPFLNGISDDQKTPGLFYFEYVNIYGDIVQTRYKLDPSYEGKMLLFPSKLRHGVNPFYATDEKRVSLSGNLQFMYRFE